MKSSHSGVNTWRQERLIPQENVRVTIEVTSLGLGQEITYSMRAVDISNEALIAMWSLPLRGAETFDHDLARTIAEFVEVLRHHTFPF